MFSGKEKQQVLEAIIELMELHEIFSMPLKPPSHNLGDEYDILGKPDDPKSNALGLTWDTEKVTLQPIYYYHPGRYFTRGSAGISRRKFRNLTGNFT